MSPTIMLTMLITMILATQAKIHHIIIHMNQNRLMLIFVLLFLSQAVLIQGLTQLKDLNEDENRTKNSKWMIKSKTVLGIWIQSSIVRLDGQKSWNYNIATYQMIRTPSWPEQFKAWLAELHQGLQQNQKLDLRNRKWPRINRK